MSSLTFHQCLTNTTITSSPSLLSHCLSSNTTHTTTTTTHTTTSSSSSSSSSTIPLDTFFLLYSSTLVFLMQAGFATLCAGSVRKSNVANTLLKNLLDCCGSAVGFYVFGYAFAFGEGGTFIGSSHFFLKGVSALDDDDYYDDYDDEYGDDDDVKRTYIFWVFQFTFAATSATIVAGTLAERCQMTAYFWYAVLLTGFAYPIIVRSLWNDSVGFLHLRGAVDFAGGGVVHLTGGVCALIATTILGARKGRFADARTGVELATPRVMEGSSRALTVLGAFLLWFGWYGFNVGSVYSVAEGRLALIAAVSAVNTTIAAGAGGICALVTRLVKTERRSGEAVFDINACINGMLGGLVSLTAGSGVVTAYASLVVGVVAGWIYLFVSELLIRLKLDDAVDAIPVHLANGAWGMLSVGLFAYPEYMEAVTERSDCLYGLFYGGGGKLLGVQLLAILFITVWVIIVMLPLFLFLHYMGWFRADSLEELVGLDAGYFGTNTTSTTNNGGNETAGEGEQQQMETYLQEYQQKRAAKLLRHRYRHNSLQQQSRRQPPPPRSSFSSLDFSIEIDGNDNKNLITAVLQIVLIMFIGTTMVVITGVVTSRVVSRQQNPNTNESLPPVLATMTMIPSIRPSLVPSVPPTSSPTHSLPERYPLPSYPLPLVGSKTDERFGTAVSFSSAGRRLAVGAPRGGSGGARAGEEEEIDPTGIVMIYNIMASTTDNINGTTTTNGTTTIPIMRWDIPGDKPGDKWGKDISLSHDGNTIAISSGSTGDVKVFRYRDDYYYSDDENDPRRRRSSEWVSIGQRRLTNGWMVSLSGDGSRIALGGMNTGAQVYDYDEVTDTWNSFGRIVTESSLVSVSLSGDGHVLVVGSPFYDDSRGRVRVFRIQKISDDNSDEQQRYLLPQLTILYGKINGDQFGHSVSSNTDGTVFAVGTSNANVVSVWEYIDHDDDTTTTTGYYIQRGADITGGHRQFGHAVSLSGSARRLAVTSPYYDGSRGRMLIYQYEGGSIRSWRQVPGDVRGSDFNDYMGWDVSLSLEGDYVAVGAMKADVGGLEDNGQVFLYELV